MWRCVVISLAGVVTCKNLTFSHRSIKVTTYVLFTTSMNVVCSSIVMIESINVAIILRVVQSPNHSIQVV